MIHKSERDLFSKNFKKTQNSVLAYKAMIEKDNQNLFDVANRSFEFLDEVFEDLFFVSNETKRGIFKNTGKLIGAALSLGGSYSLELQNKHYSDVHEAIYEPMIHSLQNIEDRTKESLESIGNSLKGLNESLRPVRKVFNSTAYETKNLKLNQYEKFQVGFDTSMNVGFGGLVGGTVALGAWGVVSIVGAASTGTAISSLSGVAATNATLAWFGGGSLAAGGAGMAGGFWVLGGIIAAPMMYFVTKNAYKKVEEVKEQKNKLLSEAERLQGMLPNARTQLLEVRKYDAHISATLQKYLPLITKELQVYKSHCPMLFRLFGGKMNPKQKESFDRLTQLVSETFIQLGLK